MTDTVRCPICHRRAPIAQGRLQPHDAGSQQCSGTGCHVPTRKPFEIAEAVVRDLRRQDDECGSDERASDALASEALARWRSEAETAGDKVVVAALMLLHPDTAVSLYAQDLRFVMQEMTIADEQKAANAVADRTRGRRAAFKPCTLPTHATERQARPVAEGPWDVSCALAPTGAGRQAPAVAARRGLSAGA